MGISEKKKQEVVEEIAIQIKLSRNDESGKMNYWLSGMLEMADLLGLDVDEITEKAEKLVSERM